MLVSKTTSPVNSQEYLIFIVCEDDDDVIEIVNEIKGGPNSAAFVGTKKVQKMDLEHRPSTGDEDQNK
jgi:hypothetical protein